MNNLNLIVAIGKNNELGIDNHLLWHLSEDLKYFKNTTMNKTIIMGRKTFESLPGLLPNRKHIIITRDINYNVDGAIIMHSTNEVLEYVNSNNEECFIIGGASIYKEFLEYTNKLYITEIDATKKADAYFLLFDKGKYNKVLVRSNIENDIKYDFVIYEKKSN